MSVIVENTFETCQLSIAWLFGCRSLLVADVDADGGVDEDGCVWMPYVIHIAILLTSSY